MPMPAGQRLSDIGGGLVVHPLTPQQPEGEGRARRENVVLALKVFISATAEFQCYVSVGGRPSGQTATQFMM